MMLNILELRRELTEIDQHKCVALFELAKSSPRGQKGSQDILPVCRIAAQLRVNYRSLTTRIEEVTRMQTMTDDKKLHESSLELRIQYAKEHKTADLVALEAAANAEEVNTVTTHLHQLSEIMAAPIIDDVVRESDEELMREFMSTAPTASIHVNAHAGVNGGNPQAHAYSHAPESMHAPVNGVRSHGRMPVRQQSIMGRGGHMTMHASALNDG